MQLHVLCYNHSTADGNDVDIVAIHGLTGDYLKTWTYTHPKPKQGHFSWKTKERSTSSMPNDNPCWIRDWLVKDLPGTRVMSLEYQADIFGATLLGVRCVAEGLLIRLKKLRSDCSKRPLVFIAHSLGGIVCKKALVMAKLEDRFKEIPASTLGILFFGTPHGGSDLANNAETPVQIINKISRQRRSRFLDELRTDNDLLLDLTPSFNNNFGHLNIIAFYESIHVGYGIKQLVVPESSARTNISHEIAVPVEKGHSDMCKFEKQADQTYDICLHQITEMLKKYNEQLDAANGRSHPLGTLSGMNARPEDNLRQGWLSEAAVQGNYDAVESLILEGGIDLSATDERGLSAVNRASKIGCVEVIRLLLDNGAKVSVPNKDGWTAIHEASFHGHLNVVRLLIGNGADLLAVDNQGMPPINKAAQKGRGDIVKFLLDHGADPSVANVDGWTALIESIFHKYPNIVRMLLEGGADHVPGNKDGWTALHTAAFRKQLVCTQLLLEYKADLSAVTSDGAMPLNKASQVGDVRIVKLFLEHGADLYFANSHQWTPLHDAVYHGYIDVVRVLLDHGADPNFGNMDEWTTLHEASHHGRLKIAQLLLERGAKPSLKNRTGNTPLHLAASQGHVDIVRLLIANGADKSILNTEGATAENCAVAKGHSNVAELLHQ